MENFNTVITSHRGWLDINIWELIHYRDLIFLYVKRNFIANYKQTILGPAWAIVQPLLTTIVFTVVFGNLAKLPTDGIPPFLFYMCGNVAWCYFSLCLTQTAGTFTANSNVLGKVYFPRLVLPISSVLSALIQFAIQLLFLIAFLIYYSILNHTVYCTWHVAVLPLVLANMALLGFGCGVIIASMTTKYRDLAFVVGFFVQLWMYATPVVYSLETVPARWRSLYLWNPMAVIIEQFRNMFFGNSCMSVSNILIAWLMTLAIAGAGVMLFNRVEKNFMDTI